MSDVLTVSQVAEHLGLSVQTVETYRADGRMPEPTMVGRTPTWTREQSDHGHATSLGRGARTDLRPPGTYHPHHRKERWENR